MSPRRSPRFAKNAEKAEEDSERTEGLKQVQNAFANALADWGNAGQIVDITTSTRSRKRKALSPEPAPSSPPGGANDAEEEEHDDDDDDDAPEPVPMKSGRKAAEDEAKRVREFEQTAAERRRQTNRQRDQTLKERADAQGGGRKKRKAAEVALEVDLEEAANIPLPPSDAIDDEQLEAEARMERAMADAAEESDEELDGQEGEDDEEAADLGDRDVDMDLQDDDATAVSGEAPERPRHTRLGEAFETEEPAITASQSKAIPRQLPDHIFASAAASISEAQKKDKLKKKAKKKAKKKEKASEKERKQRRKEALKDRVIGSRTVRVLSSQPHPDTGVKSGIAAARFVRQSLNLTKPQNGLQKKKNPKGWERRAAHLTLSQGSSGPARGFARSVKQ